MEPERHESPDRRGRTRRRRRGSGEPSRGLYLLPHLITTANVSFGFFAIVQCFAGRYETAALGIILAGVCDAIDGRVARLAQSTSRFGQEYDSIADTVSFGVAPAILAFSAGNLEVLGRPGWLMACLFTVCAALRLARFNVSPGRFRARFEGLPSPAAAGMVAWMLVELAKTGKASTIGMASGVVAALVAITPAAGFMGSMAAQYGWVARRHVNRVLTFVLDGKARLPANLPSPGPETPIDDPAFRVDLSKAERGATLYSSTCMACHGSGAVAAGYAPDLRASAVLLSEDVFKQIVHDGLLLEQGMPTYAELTDVQLEELRHFIRARAREAVRPQGKSRDHSQH